MLADGRLTSERRAELEADREQFGLSKEASDRIIGRIANERVSSSLQVSCMSPALGSQGVVHKFQALMGHLSHQPVLSMLCEME